MKQKLPPIRLAKPIKGKKRIIRNVRFNDGESIEAKYYGWRIHIYPMWGKLVNGVYREDLKSGKIGVDVTGSDGGYIANSWEESYEEAWKVAVENILSCRPLYGEN